MKYTEQQKEILRNHKLLNFRPFQKEIKQQKLQEEIDSHYPIKENYITLESKINK